MLLNHRPGDEGRPGVRRLTLTRRTNRRGGARRRQLRLGGATTGWSGSTDGGTSCGHARRSAVPAFSWAAPSACSKSVPAQHLAVGRFLGRHPRHHRRSPAPPGGDPASAVEFDTLPAASEWRATPGGAPATSTAMAWMTSSASGRSPVRGRPRSLDPLRRRTRATHTKVILTTTTTWTVCPTPGSRARSGREG